MFNNKSKKEKKKMSEKKKDKSHSFSPFLIKIPPYIPVYTT